MCGAAKIDANQDGAFSWRMSWMSFAAFAAGLSVAYAWNKSLRRYVPTATAVGRESV
ncbi:MAG: hypothetical protein OXD50_08360 [Chloroflexi bacterium]|nr:hypothetical protein [Chloroflexota bacterium]